MNSAYPLRKIGEIATITRGSSPRPIKDTRYFEGGTIPWIKIADATASGKYLRCTRQHVNEFGASFSRILPPKTILVAASGTLGYTQMLGVTGCAHDGWLILQELNGVDRDYLYYALKTLEQHFYGSAYGAAIQNINTTILREAQIPLPDEATQQHIGAILSSYDDLIEVNTRRIAILEEMALRLFDEWFIQFHFPDGQSVDLHETDYGKIPHGWGVAPLEELYDTRSGSTPSRLREDYFGGDIPWVKTKELNGGPIFDTEEHISEAGLKNSATRVFPARTVIVAMYGATIGELGVLAVPATTNQACCALLPKTKTYGWVYAFLTFNAHKSRLVELRTGAAQQNISQVVIRNFPILKPPPKLLNQFDQFALPALDAAFNLYRCNTLLRATRDLLLPKLISGEIDLSQAEAKLEAAQ